MRRPLTAWLKADGGASAVEFALIAPVLVMLYAAVAEYSQALMADRRVGQIAASVGDLVAQTDEISDSEIKDILTIGAALIQPYPSKGLKVRVTSVTVNAQNKPVVDWSDASGLTAHKPGDVVVLPLAKKAKPSDPDRPFIASGQSVIMAESEYVYNSPIDYFISGGRKFDAAYYLKPRKSDKVARVK